MKRRVRYPAAVGFVVVATVAAGIVLTSCAGDQMTITTETGYDSHVLRHNFGPYPAIEAGKPNSCIETSSQVHGRDNICRVLDGYDQDPAHGFNDHRNFVIKWFPYDAGAPLYAWRWRSGDAYGLSIILDDGNAYEGCDWYSPDNSYHCDLHVRRYVVPVSGGSWSYVLHKMWDWTLYQGNALGCAGGIAGILVDKPVTLPLLADCVDGPP